MEHDSALVKHFGASSWTADRLRAVSKTYTSLEPKTRLKILTSFLHLPMRTYSELQTELAEFIHLGIEDSDPWIRSIASIVASLPERGCLNETSLPDSNTSAAYKILIATLNNKQSSQLNIAPVDTMYLTRPTATTLFSSAASTAARLMSPQAPGGPANVPSLLPHHQLVKHFTLRRKPKSAELRAQLVQRSTDGSIRTLAGASSASTPGGLSTVPIKMRSFAKKMNVDQTETKGGFDGFLPSSRLQSSTTYAMAGNRQAALHAATSGAAGVKVLELADLPSTFDPRKRHRASISEAKIEAKAAERAKQAAPIVEEPPKEAKEVVKEESSSFAKEAEKGEDSTKQATSPGAQQKPAQRKRASKSETSEKGPGPAEKAKAPRKKAKKDGEAESTTPTTTSVTGITTTTAAVTAPVIAAAVAPSIQEDAEKEAKQASEMVSNEVEHRPEPPPLVAAPTDFSDVPKLVSCVNESAAASAYRLATPMAFNPSQMSANVFAAMNAAQSQANNLFSLFQPPVNTVPMRVVTGVNPMAAFQSAMAFRQDPNMPFRLLNVQQAAGLPDASMFQMAGQQQMVQMQMQMQQQAASQQQQQQMPQQTIVFTAQGPVIIPR